MSHARFIPKPFAVLRWVNNRLFFCLCLTACFTVHIRWWWRKRGPDEHVAARQRSFAVTPSLSTTRTQHPSIPSTTSLQSSPLGASQPLYPSQWGTTGPTMASGMHHYFPTRAIVSTTRLSAQLTGWVLTGGLPRPERWNHVIQCNTIFFIPGNAELEAKLSTTSAST